jgi:hypothetical protein
MLPVKYFEEPLISSFPPSSTSNSIPTYLQRKHAAGIGNKAPTNLIRAEKKGG